MPRGALYNRSIGLLGLPEIIRDLGGSPEGMFAQKRMDMSLIKSGDSFYDWSKICHLLEDAAEDLNEPAFGVKWAHSLKKDFQGSGPMLLLAALTPTVGGWADLAIEYQKLQTNGVRYSYSESSDTDDTEVLIQVHPASPPCRQFTEHIMAILFLMERHYINKAMFTKVTFQHNAPADMSWHEKLFKCPIEFNAVKTAAYIKPELLTLKVGGQLKRLKPILRLYLQRRIKKNAIFNMSIAQTVEQMLPTIFGTGMSNMNQVATFMEISPKKLQRLLKEEGVTFSDILENVRKNTAHRLLFESDIAVSHLASFLDYASAESFNAACKRWFGLPPLKYRQQLRYPAA